VAAKVKELEGKAEEVRERRAKLAEFLKDFVDGCVELVFLLSFYLTPCPKSLRPSLP
jgi:hypothetical protein